MIETHRYLGLKFSVFTLDELKNDIIGRIKTREQNIYFGYSLTQLPWIKKHPLIYHLSEQFDMFVPDGKGFYFLLKFLGFPIGDHINLPDLADLLAHMANEKKYKIFLLGATPEVNRKAVENLRLKYPKAIIPYGIDGYYQKTEEICIIEKINIEKPDILLIGITSPKKEQFAVDWRNKLEVPVIVPCGGVIDVYAGKTKREPRWMLKFGLAWLYRFTQEPVRMYSIIVRGFSVLFGFIPCAWFNVVVKGKKNYSFREYYKFN